MNNKLSKLSPHLITLVCGIIGAFLQSLVIKSFIEPAGLVASGITGVSVLTNKLGTMFFGDTISIAMISLSINIPIAIICYKGISKRFVISSFINVFLNSLFLKTIDFSPIFNQDDNLMNIIFGGFLYGMSTVITLKGRTSLGGTDLIALYVSVKKGKSIWYYMFAFNVMLLCISGIIFGWQNIGYSILFQFVCTKTVATFHQRFKRVTIQATTKRPDEIIEKYIKNFKHGLSCTKAIGGYSKEEVTIIHSVVSSYEVPDVIECMRSVDPKVIINTMKTEQFYGPFYEEPL